MGAARCVRQRPAAFRALKRQSFYGMKAGVPSGTPLLYGAALNHKGWLT